MDKYERIPVSKTEIDRMVDNLCSKYDCGIEYLPVHLDEEGTWRIRPILPAGEVDLETFALELTKRLNLNEGTDFFVRVTDMLGESDKPYITIEKLTNE
jgi:hypothetical protein